MLKLEQVLDMPELKGVKVIAGMDGIERNVTSVSVMDAPDIYKWMKGGELLITTAYAIKDDIEYCKELIVRLNGKNVAALGIKVDRFIRRVPEDAIAVANELGFPLLYLPKDMAFIDLINPVLNEIIGKQSEVMLYTEKVHNAFTKMVLENEEIPEILKFLEEYIQCDTIFVDTWFDKIYISENCKKNEKFLKDVSETLNDSSGLEQLLKRYGFYRLHSDNEEYGYILFAEDEVRVDVRFKDYYRVVIEQAGTVLILKVQKKLAESQIEANYREQFVQDLLNENYRTKQEIINRAKIYNWEFYFGGNVVIVDVDHFKAQYLGELDIVRNTEMEKTMKQIFLISNRIMKREFQMSVYSRLNDQIVYVISDMEGEKYSFRSKIKRVSEEIIDTVRTRVPFTVTIGIGDYKKGIQQMSESWLEAKKAVAISQNLYRENVLSVYEDLGAYKLLILVGQSEEAKEFERIYVQKLESYDQIHNAELLHTAIYLIMNGWNLKITSQKLFIHYNSMKYRYQKICQILDVNLNDTNQRFNFEVAIKLYQIQEKNRII